MITLEIRIDEPSLKDDLRFDPAGADVALLEETYFVMPVRLAISGQELLTPDGWAPLPILGFARRLYEETRKLEPGR
jgi:hypothetical protein